LPSSPRARRRLTWIALALVVAGGAAAAMAAIPGRSGHIAQHFTAAPPDLVTVHRRIPVSAAERRAIDSLLDRFVPDAVGREDPGAAYELATPALRAGSSAADWRR